MKGRHYSTQVESARDQGASERTFEANLTIGDYLRQAWESFSAKVCTSFSIGCCCAMSSMRIEGFHVDECVVSTGKDESAPKRVGS